MPAISLVLALHIDNIRPDGGVDAQCSRVYFQLSQCNVPKVFPR
jgi:hypothetical protein